MMKLFNLTLPALTWILLQNVPVINARSKVLILGAGMAGISAGKALTDLGETDFIILEGSDRIGGRIRAEEIGGYYVETGAAWISAIGRDEIIKLSDKYNVSYQLQEYEEYVALDMQGRDVTDEADARYEVLEPAVTKAQNLSRRLNVENLDTSWRDSSARAALRRNGWIPRSPLDFSMEYWEMEFVFAQASEVVSTVYFGFPFYGDSYGEYIVLDQDGGFEKIVKMLAQEFLQPDDERLIKDSIVSKIMYNDDSVTVETIDGQQYSADYAIVTFSLGVLKDPVAVTFDPKLPDWKLDSIAQYNMAQYAGIVVKFDESEQAFWDSEEWTLIASERRGHYSLMQNFNIYFPGSNMIMFTLAGDEMSRIGKLSDDEIKAEISDILKQVYNRSIPAITEIVVPRWVTNPLYYGSYSDWSVGYSNRVHDALRSRIGRVHFAGEAYDREWFGYVNGAHRSGKRTADEVIQCIQGTKDCPMFDPNPKSRGCTYAEATNYKEDADIDDGSCAFKKE